MKTNWTEFARQLLALEIGPLAKGKMRAEEGNNDHRTRCNDPNATFHPFGRKEIMGHDGQPIFPLDVLRDHPDKYPKAKGEHLARCERCQYDLQSSMLALAVMQKQ
jgi:hypothetical protein